MGINLRRGKKESYESDQPLFTLGGDYNKALKYVETNKTKIRDLIKMVERYPYYGYTLINKTVTRARAKTIFSAGVKTYVRRYGKNASIKEIHAWQLGPLNIVREVV